MAITIKQAPDTFSPVYNPMIFVLQSTNSSQANFKFVADIYIAGVATPAFYRYDFPADPDVGTGKIDVSRALEKHLSFDINQTNYGFQQNTKSFVNYTCYFGEAYGPSSGVTVTSGVTVDSSRYAYNGVFDFPDFATYTSADYLMASTSIPFLTNMGTSGTVRASQDAWFYLITNTVNRVSKMQIKTFNSSDAVIQTVDVTNTYKALNNASDRFLRFSAGTRNLNSIAAGDITAGSQPIITSSVVWYTVQAFDGVPAAVSKAYRYDINSTCTDYTVYQFFWLNKLGGFDQFSFIKLSRKTSEIKRQNYKAIYGTQTAAAWSYNRYDRGKKQYDTQIKEKITVWSDWVSDSKATWLKELFTSPEVYVNNGTTRDSVIITDTSFEEKQTVNDKTINYQITFEYSYDNYRQRQ